MSEISLTAISSPSAERLPAPPVVLKILIADDTDTDRMILESIVRREGHQVISARNGFEAVAGFRSEAPDIVLLDALMPELDGFEAARQIKQLAGERLVPVIFLTSLTDSESLVKCLDAGGDDFLSKPYNRVILQAKIKSFDRMRSMHATMLSQRNQIARHHNHLLQEQAVAKQVFDNIAHTGCLNASNVRFLLSPMAVFNGDVLVAAMHPSGSMLVLLGDFTGHGLPAAIGAMPLASIFYGMVRKGFAMVDILREINLKLKQILPVGVFCCATMVEMQFRKKLVKIWNGGLPDGVIYREAGGAVQKIHSRHLPLGILADKDFRDDCVRYELDYGDRLYLWSDGIIEARNPAGAMFGEERLLQVFSDDSDDSDDSKGSNDNAADIPHFERILHAVHAFSGTADHDDDLSLIEIRMVPPEQLSHHLEEVFPNISNGLMEWALDLEIKPSSFKMFDPLPLLLSVLVEVPGLRRHSGSLYSILAELYSNGLEHGILQLDSAWKVTPEGFARYYRERSERLAALQEGFIRIRLSHETNHDGGTLTIVVEDSGSGFLHPASIHNNHSTAGYSGRGIPLIRSLCRSLRYLGCGNQVEAVFVWEVDH